MTNPKRAVFLALATFAALAPASGAAQQGDGWTLAGRLGMMQLVVVDDSRVADEPTHHAAIRALCAPEQTCFVRFYANPQKVPLGVPLPDAIANAPTAFYSRSAKQGNATFQWSCRVRNDPGRCF